MIAANIDVLTHEIGHTIEISKTEWKSMITNRVWSIYIDMSEADIEVGLKETDELFNQGPTLTFIDKFTIFTALAKAPIEA